MAKRIGQAVIGGAITVMALCLLWLFRLFGLFYLETFGNCLIYSFHRLHTVGGYVCLRWSDYGPWLHVEWSPDLETFYSFDPLIDKTHRRLPPIVFEGKVNERKRNRG
jgi:hypothetical protein